MSRLETKEDPLPNIEIVSDQFGFDDKDLPDKIYLLNFQTLGEYQEKDEKLMKKLANNSHYTLASFHGVENKKIDLITREGEIVK